MANISTQGPGSFPSCLSSLFPFPPLSLILLRQRYISAPLFKARPSAFFLSFFFDLYEAAQETTSTFPFQLEVSVLHYVIARYSS